MKQSTSQIQKMWHAEPAAVVLSAWRSCETGLSADEVARRQQEYGLNVLPEKGPAPLWRIVLRQFISPLIYILVAAAVVSALIGDFKDAAFIGVVLLLNAIIGAYQEWQAEQSSQALKKLLNLHAHVERDGEVREVIYLLISMGIAELLMVLLAVVSGLPVPLHPVQLLWLNLVTNGIQGVALVFEPGEVV